MKRSLLLFCMLSVFAANAQIKRFSFKAAANYPVIPTVRTSTEITSLPLSSGYVSSVITATVKESYESRPGFDLGGSVDYSFTPRFFITTGLNLSYLRFKKLITIEELNGGGINSGFDIPATGTVGAPFGSITFRDLNENVIVDENGLPERASLRPSDDKGNTTTFYMQVPVLMGTTFFHNKLLVRAGVSFSYLIGTTQYLDKYSYTSGTIESYKEKSRDGYTTFLASGTITATYMITRSFGIDLSANKFLSPIYNQSQQSSGKAKYNTFSLGFSYNINR